jgi:hypothetical protein
MNQNQIEKPVAAAGNGWFAVIMALIVVVVAGYSIYNNWTVVSDPDPVQLRYGFSSASSHSGANWAGIIVRGVLAIFALCCLLGGTVSLQQNEAVVFTFTGKYMGTLRGAGFFWVPFWWNSYSKRTLAIQTYSIKPMVVNDAGGKPILIGGDIFCYEKDTWKATFCADNLEAYLLSKGEIAFRNLAMGHHMDSSTPADITLLGNIEKVIEQLKIGIAPEFEGMGYVVDKAAITTLQYTPEVAAMMLQRQNAEATVDARNTIAKGACGTVKEVLTHLKTDGVEFADANEKTRFVGNLVITLCSHQSVSPVLSVSQSNN